MSYAEASGGLYARRPLARLDKPGGSLSEHDLPAGLYLSFLGE